MLILSYTVYENLMHNNRQWYLIATTRQLAVCCVADQSGKLSDPCKKMLKWNDSYSAYSAKLSL